MITTVFFSYGRESRPQQGTRFKLISEVARKKATPDTLLTTAMLSGNSVVPAITLLFLLLLAGSGCGIGGFNSHKLKGTYDAEIVLARPEGSESSGWGNFAQGLANLALKTTALEFNFHDDNTGSIHANFGIFELLRAFDPQPGARAADFQYKVNRKQELLIKTEGKDNYEVFARIDHYSKDYKYIRLALSNEENEQMLYIDLKKSE